MADKFSIDDILAEYSDSENKKLRETANELKFDSEKENDEKSRSDIKLSPEGSDKADDFLSENIQIGDEEKEEADNSESFVSDTSDAEENSDQSAETEEKSERERKSLENAAAISNLSKHRQKKGSVMSNSVPPVNRASLKDIKMGLTGKIIPKTEEFDKTSIPDNATYEEKSAALSQHRKKKVESFVLKNDEDMSEREKNTAKTDENRVSGQKEFENFDEASKILGDILQVKSNLFVRLCVLLFAGIFSVLITVANDFELPLIKTFDLSISPSAFLFTNTILGLLSIAVSYTVLLAGVKNILRRKADCDSIAAISIFVTTITGIICLFDPESLREGYYHVYISVSIVGLIFNTLGKMMIVNRTEKNFRYVAGEYDRYAVKNVSDENTASNFTKGVISDYPQLAAMRKTEFIEDFMKHSYASDVSDEFAKKAAPLIFIAGIVLGLLSFIFDKHAANFTDKLFVALAAFSGIVTMCSSLALMLVVNVPMTRASKKFLQYSSVMLGYSAVEEYADTNSVLVDAEQLFPNGMVDFVNLKLMSTTSVEECILMASSLACQAGSVLKHPFYKMLRGKTEMLYPVESYLYEDGMGLSGWIDNKRVLLGTRELMENHSIDGLPTLGKELEYGKGNTVIYLSISGVVSTLFVIQVNPSLSVTKWLQELENEGIAVVIRSVDGFLSSDFLSKLFEIEESSIKLLPFRYHKEYENETEYVPRMSSSMLCSGHFPSFAMLIVGAKRLKFAANLGIAIQMGSIVLAAVISLVMMLTGSFVQITPSVVLCYNLVFVVATLLIQKIKKI